MPRRKPQRRLDRAATRQEGWFLPIDLTREEEVRFWSRVRRNDGPGDCWLWEGAGPVPTFSFAAESGKWRNVRARRVMYTLEHGRIPDGAMVLRRCKTSMCVNPAHMTPGGPPKIALLKIARGTMLKGERSPVAKLKRTAVDEMRRLSEQGWTHDRLAKRFRIDKGHVSAITRGEAWRDDRYGRRDFSSRMSRPGELSPNAKLTWRKVEEIRRQIASGRRYRDIARAFGIVPGTIDYIAQNKSWKVSVRTWSNPRRLTWTKVTAIRREIGRNQKTYAELACDFGVSVVTVERLAANRVWRVKRPTWKHRPVRPPRRAQRNREIDLDGSVGDPPAPQQRRDPAQAGRRLRRVRLIDPQRHSRPHLDPAFSMTSAYWRLVA